MKARRGVMPEETGGAFVRAVALALADTEEREHMGSASFRVAGKIFAQLDAGETVALVKMSRVEQEQLVRADPDRFGLPPHWAKFGWTYVRIADLPADQLRGFLERSWHRIAPKRISASRNTEFD